MGILRKETFVCVDCESTGLDPETDHIIEVAAVHFTFDEIIDRYETLVDPGVPIPAESMAIHHITEEMVEGKPKIKTILPELIDFIGSATVVGHGVLFDLQLIANAAKRHDIPCNLANQNFFDTLRLARYYGRSPINSLEELRKHFNIPAEGAHRAMSDVIVNVEVFKQLCRNYKTVQEVEKILSKPVRLKNMPLGKHKGRLFSDIPTDYLKWAANKDFDNDLLFSIRSELKKRKKGGLFTQATNPFHNL